VPANGLILERSLHRHNKLFSIEHYQQAISLKHLQTSTPKKTFLDFFIFPENKENKPVIGVKIDLPAGIESVDHETSSTDSYYRTSFQKDP